MRLLLDTHVWLWSLAAPERIAPELRERMSDANMALFLSVASVWEIAIKYRLGRLPLPEPPERFIPARLVRDGVVALPVEVAHAARVASLPDHHADPFDRILVAQAQVEGMTIATADRALSLYEVALIRA